MKLIPSQQTVFEKLLPFLRSKSHDVKCLVGHAGTGKTFVVAELVKYLVQDTSMNVYVAAFTHKASNVLNDKITDAIGRSSAPNLHVNTVPGLFGLRPVLDYNNGDRALKIVNKVSFPPRKAAFIIDEASMICELQLRTILKYAKERSVPVLFVGDPWQLLPVNQTGTSVFSKYEQVRLTEIVRQEAGNPIIQLAEQYRQAIITGENEPIIKDTRSDFGSIFVVNKAVFLKGMVKSFRLNVETRVLAYHNHMVQKYNHFIRPKLIPDGDVEPYTCGETITNSSAVYEGDINAAQITMPTDTVAEIVEITPRVDDKAGIKYLELTVENQHGAAKCRVVADRSEEQKRVAKMKEHRNKAMALTAQINKSANKSVLRAAKASEWTLYYYYKEFFNDIRSIYASTVHKAQGSTFERVFVDTRDLAKVTSFEDRMRLLYVACTRTSRELVVL